MARLELVTRTFVELADNLVDDFDVVEVLTLLADRCVEMLDVTAAGLMLVDPSGELRVLASSSEAMRVVEVFELQAQEGPCLEAFLSGQAVVNQDLAIQNGRWPRFAPVAVDAGFRSAHALPMRLRQLVIGVLNLFRAGTGELQPTDVALAQALADVATIAILQHRATTEATKLNEQLHHALNSRIAIEQAKGVLAERSGLSMENAFARLRQYARSHNRLLFDVARDVVDGRLPAAALEGGRA